MGVHRRRSGLVLSITELKSPAQSIGWAPSPFQKEIAGANLGIGLGALLPPFLATQRLGRCYSWRQASYGTQQRFMSPTWCATRTSPSIMPGRSFGGTSLRRSLCSLRYCCAQAEPSLLVDREQPWRMTLGCYAYVARSAKCMPRPRRSQAAPSSMIVRR
jgi:hypothetical protein